MPEVPKTQKTPTARTLSVRTWLMALALAIIALMAIDRVRLLEAQRSERVTLARAEAVDLARQTADIERNVLEAARAMLKTVARLYPATAKGDCKSFLAPFVADMPWVKSLSVVGADGRIVCSTEPGDASTDLGDRPFVEKARQSADFAIGSDGAAVMAAYPVRGRDKAGATEAVIVARTDFDWFDRLGTTGQRREGIATMLVDARGNVIAGQGGSSELAGRSISDHPVLRDVLARPDGTLVGAGLDGVQRVMAFTRLPDIDASVVVGLDERQFVSRLYRDITLAYVQFIMAAAVILVAVWVGIKRLIVEPTRVLATMATRIGRGEREPRPKQKMIWAAEFAPLTAALTEMASRLAEREHGLRSANRQLSTLAAVDSLTKLPNRRSFDAGLEDEWERAYEQGWPVALMMIDVDHFKQYNDHYGHLVGDRCLELVGEALSATVPTKADFAARYGGEEFALLLPATALRAALNAAERLRATVEQLDIPHEKAERGHVTVSIGVASLMPTDKNTAQDLIEAADAGLYEAKRLGRNTVGVRSPNPNPVPAADAEAAAEPDATPAAAASS
jgi:diguanylate cyclase (GGDEF)-like protein